MHVGWSFKCIITFNTKHSAILLRVNYIFKLHHSIGKCDITWYGTFPTQYWKMSPFKLKIWHILLNKCHINIGIMSAPMVNFIFNLVSSRSLIKTSLSYSLKSFSVIYYWTEMGWKHYLRLYIKTCFIELPSVPGLIKSIFITSEGRSIKWTKILATEESMAATTMEH